MIRIDKHRNILRVGAMVSIDYLERPMESIKQELMYRLSNEIIKAGDSVVEIKVMDSDDRAGKIIRGTVELISR